MEHKKDTSLSDAVAANVTKQEMDSIISDAIAMPGATGRSLHETLILSGVALGVDGLSRFAIATLHRQIIEVRKAIAKIDEAVQNSDAADAVLEWARSIRQGLVDHMNEQISLVTSQQAVQVQQATGIDKDILLMRGPKEDIDPATLISLGLSLQVQHGVSFLGFAGHADVTQMECKCLGCLAMSFAANQEPMSPAIQRGVARYGSADGLAAEFAWAVISTERARLSKFSDEYGTADALTPEAAASETNRILSQFTFGGGPEGEHGTD